MKKIIFTLAVTTFMAGIMLTGCQSSADKVKDAKDNVTEAKQDLNQAVKDSIEQFKQESEAKISANDVSINDLKAKIATERKENKADYEKKLAALEQKNSDMKKKLAEFKDDEQTKWKTFKNEFNHDMDELGNAFKDFWVKSK